MGFSGAPKGCSIGAVALVVLGAVPAAAAPKLQAIAETAVGFTDNVRASPENPLTEGGERSSAVFLMLSPGVVLALESPRALQRFGYRYEYNLFFSESDASSSSNRLDYGGFFELSRRVSLVLGANATESSRYTTVAFAPPGAGVVGALPTGTGTFLQAGLDEATSFDVAVGWRAWQGSSAIVATPILGTQAPRTKGVGARTGVERSFSVDALGLETRADYSTVVDGVRSDGSASGVQRQLVVAAVASWRRDWGRYFTSRAEAGALRFLRFETSRGFWAPTGAAMFGYASEVGDAQLSYAHSVTSNVLLGQSLLVDEFRLRAALPLTGGGELMLAAASAYQRGRLIDADASLAARVDVILLDVSLGWNVTRALELGLRYQHVRQVSDATVPPLPLSFVQHNILLGGTLRFPSESDMPRPYRAPRRVDRSDEIREGTWPAAEGHDALDRKAP